MRTLIARTQYAVRTYRYDLPLILLKKLLAPLLTTEKILLFSRDLDANAAEGALPARTASPGVDICSVDGADSVLFAQLCEQFPDRDFPARWREFGTRCFIASIGDRIAGFAWVGRYRLRIAEINYQYPLANDELFIYDCFVAPECRGRGIYPAMIEAILQDYRMAQPVPARALIAVSSVNRASLRGIVKAGFTEFNRILYVNWQGREQWWGLDAPERRTRGSQ